MSGNAAVGLLVQAGHLGKNQARDVLRCGLVGPALRQGRTLLYEERRVRELMEWPRMSTAEAFDRSAGWRLILLRVAASRGLDLARSPEEQRRAIAGPWPIAGIATGIVRMELQRGPVAVIATVGGFVAVTADLLGIAMPPDGPYDQHHLELGPPGRLARGFARRRVIVPAGRSIDPWVTCLWTGRTPHVLGADGTGLDGVTPLERGEDPWSDPDAARRRAIRAALRG